MVSRRTSISAENLQVSRTICEIIQRHNYCLPIIFYDRPVEIALQATDSASGLIIACALVKGSRLSDVSVKTIPKKAKEMFFAGGYDRIALIAPLVGIPAFYEDTLAGMRKICTNMGIE
jgi:hypothetical protein